MVLFALFLDTMAPVPQRLGLLYISLYWMFPEKQLNTPMKAMSSMSFAQMKLYCHMKICFHVHDVCCLFEGSYVGVYANFVPVS